MSLYFELHRVNPEPRLIRRAAEVIRAGGVIAYPTDSCYALGCHIGDKAALDRIRAIYTFLMPATRETPRRLQHDRRRTIGIRVPDHVVPRQLLAELGEPIMTSTLMLPGDDAPLNDGREIAKRLSNDLDLVLDGGPCGLEPTTVVDLAVQPPAVLRVGKGNLGRLGLASASGP